MSLSQRNLKSVSMDLEINNSDLSGNPTEFKTLPYTVYKHIIVYTTDSSSTLIDLIYTNSPDRVVCSGVSHISISDHSLVYAFCKLSIEFPSRGHNTVTYRKLKNFNSDRFRNDIFLQNWDDIYCHDNPNDMWDA